MLAGHVGSGSTAPTPFALWFSSHVADAAGIGRSELGNQGIIRVCEEADAIGRHVSSCSMRGD